MIRKITQQEIAERAVSNMAIRPNDRSSYGAGGMSPAEVRARFDALALLIILRYNELVDEIDSGLIGGGGDIPAFKALLDDIASGAFAGYMQVYGENGELSPLQNVLNDIYGGVTGGGSSDAVGIAKIEQTVTSTADGGENVITVTLSNGNTETFTIRNGSKGSTGSPGAPGKNGADGVGIASVEQIEVSVADSGTNVFRITLTDGDYRDIYIKNGSRGTAPVRGEDFWTPADKAEIVAEVLSNFTNASEVAM